MAANEWTATEALKEVKEEPQQAASKTENDDSTPKRHKASIEHSKSALARLCDLSVAEFLTEMKIPNKVVVLSSELEPKAAFQILLDHHILSAPVHEHGNLIGFLDIRDLVSFAVFAVRSRPEHEDVELELPIHTLMSQHEFFHPKTSVEETRMYENPLSGMTTSYLCRRNKFVAVSMDERLPRVLQLLASRVVHRVPVVDQDGALTGIISQSNIIAFLQKATHTHPEAFAPTIQEIKIGSSPVFSALATAPALAAFELIDKKQVTGLAMIDLDGALVGNISASDIKLLLKMPNLKILSRPLREFLTTIRKQEIHSRAPAVTVPRDAPLSKVVGKLAATKMHRVFVCDENHHPISVISLTDILGVLM